MNTQRAKELLIDYLNGHLEGEEKIQLEGLLRTDEKLRLEAETIEREIGILRSAVHDPLEDARMQSVSIRVMNELRERRSGSLRDLPLPWRSYLRAAVIVVLVVAAVTIFFLLRPADFEEGLRQAVGERPYLEVRQPVKPRAIRMSFATDDPKVKIYWTLSEDFELDEEGE
jgi:anti-sigma factor RsiW